MDGRTDKHVEEQTVTSTQMDRQTDGPLFLLLCDQYSPSVGLPVFSLAVSRTKLPLPAATLVGAGAFVKVIEVGGGGSFSFSKSFPAVLLNSSPQIKVRLCFRSFCSRSVPSLRLPTLFTFMAVYLFSSLHLSFFSLFEPTSPVRRLPAHGPDVAAPWQRPRGAAADRPPGLLHQHPQRGGVHPRDPGPECKRPPTGEKTLLLRWEFRVGCWRN